MRVALNATSLLSPLTGIGQYTRQLAEGLIRSPGIEVEFFYGATWSATVRPAPLPGAGNILPWLRSHIPFSYALRRIVQSTQFCQRAKQARFDLYHEPNILPLPFDGPTVITVHDLSWIRHPEAHPLERVRAMNTYFQPGLERANLVLTDSMFVKNELMDLFHIKSDMICPIPLGVEALFQPRSMQETYGTLSQWGLTHGRYFLAVGTMEPRKNLQTALDAYGRLPADIRQSFPLVLSGMKGWNSSRLEARIRDMAAGGQLLNIGYLPRLDLANVVAGATALVFPSIYEGFGLPLLEAMACGVPVISSNAASMPEVVGGAGILLNPHDIDGMTLAMNQLANSPSDRVALGSRALEQSKHFSWSTCLNQTIDAYRRVLPTSGL